MALTARRKQRILNTLRYRQKDLTLVIDNIHDPHNVSAIIRSCDAFGVYRIHLYYTTEQFPQIGKKSSASANKWVERAKHNDHEELYRHLKGQGMQVLSTGFSEQARSLDRWDLSRPTAIILGNEHRGLSPELSSLADGELYIPMQGMVQSLNVSVAAAVILYESWRQRKEKGLLDHPSFDSDTLDRLFAQWSRK